MTRSTQKQRPSRKRSVSSAIQHLRAPRTRSVTAMSSREAMGNPITEENGIVHNGSDIQSSFLILLKDIEQEEKEEVEEEEEEEEEEIQEEEDILDWWHDEDLDSHAAGYSVQFATDAHRAQDTDEDMDVNERDESDEEGVYHLRSVAPTTSNTSRTRVVRTSGRKYEVQSPKVMEKAIEMMTQFGYTPAHVSKLMGVPSSTIERHFKQFGRTNERVPAPRQQKITAAGHLFLVNFIRQHKTATLNQLQSRYRREFDVKLNPSSIYRHLTQRCNVTLKRAQRYPIRRNSDRTKRLRMEYVRDNIDSGKINYERNCVFLDEASFNATMVRNYAWSQRGQPAHVEVSAMRSKATSLVAAISNDGLVEACIKTDKGGTNSYDFLAFVKAVMKRLKEDDKKNCFFVCDNASIHKADFIADALKDEGHQIVFLPPYSPMLNPIENMFSKVKALYRQDPLSDTESEDENEDDDGDQDPVEQDSSEGPESSNDVVARRLTEAMSHVTLSDYQNYVAHAVTYFDHCRNLADHL